MSQWQNKVKELNSFIHKMNHPMNSREEREAMRSRMLILADEVMIAFLEENK